MATAQEAVIETPPMFQDEQINFTPSASINKRLTRYVCFIGDVLSSRRKHDFKDGDRDAGGEELPSRALWRVKGFVRRGRITPVEIGPEWHTKEEISETDVQDALNAGRVTMSVKGQPEFYGTEVLPGNEIASIVAVDEAIGVAKGIVELTALAGRDWVNDSRLGTDPEILALQRHFIPAYPALPVTLQEVEGLITRAPREEVLGWNAEVIETIQSELIDSCINFRLWGTEYVELENQRIAARVGVGGFTYTYSDVAKVIMRQLEIEPLTVSQLKEKAAQLDQEQIARIAAAAASEVMKGQLKPALSLDDLKMLIKANPDEFKELFADVVPKRKQGRSKES